MSDPVPTLQEILLREAEDPLVTLDQIAALVGLAKCSMKRYVREARFGMPPPHIQGAGGRPSYWRWSVVRPWLVATFGRQELPVTWRVR